MEQNEKRLVTLALFLFQKNKSILKKLDLIYLFTFCCFTFVALTNV